MKKHLCFLTFALSLLTINKPIFDDGVYVSDAGTSLMFMNTVLVCGTRSANWCWLFLFRTTLSWGSFNCHRVVDGCVTGL